MRSVRSIVAGVAWIGPEYPNRVSSGSRPVWSRCVRQHHRIQLPDGELLLGSLL